MSLDLSMTELELAMRKLARTVKNDTIEACAKIAENCFGGKAHTYASENADIYRAQDAACSKIAARIRTLAGAEASEVSDDR